MIFNIIGYFIQIIIIIMHFVKQNMRASISSFTGLPGWTAQILFDHDIWSTFTEFLSLFAVFSRLGQNI